MILEWFLSDSWVILEWFKGFLRVEFFQQLRQLYHEFHDKSEAGVLRLWIGLAPYVIVAKGFTAEAILGSYKFIEKGPEYEMLQPW